MKDKTKEDIGIAFTLILCCVVLFLMIRGYEIYSGPDVDTVCENEYGRNWSFENTKYFGQTCIKLDYITLEIVDRKPVAYTNISQQDDYCNRPGFFEFSTWDNGCDKTNDISSESGD